MGYRNRSRRCFEIEVERGAVKKIEWAPNKGRRGVEIEVNGRRSMGRLSEEIEVLGVRKVVTRF